MSLALDIRPQARRDVNKIAADLVSQEAGTGGRAIAERLNSEGHPTRTGKPWAPETVRQIAMRRRSGVADAGDA